MPDQSLSSKWFSKLSYKTVVPFASECKRTHYVSSPPFLGSSNLLYPKIIICSGFYVLPKTKLVIVLIQYTTVIPTLISPNIRK